MSRKAKILALILSLLVAVLSLVPACIVFAEEGEEEATSDVSSETTEPTSESITDLGTINVSMNVGDKKNLATVYSGGLGGSAKYSSDNTSVVGVIDNYGNVQALREGTANVRARSSTKTVVFRVTVNAKPSTSAKTLTTVSATLNLTVEKGKSTTLSHAGLSGNITFRSGNNQIATVSSSGVVKAVKVGTTYIQAFNSTHIQNYQITVTEAEDESVTVEETTTAEAESETVTIEDVVGLENETTTIYSANVIEPVDDNSDNSGLKTRILIITAIIILVIIIAAIVIYRFIASRNNEDYPVDFYPDNDVLNNSGNGENNVPDELPEYNFSEPSDDNVEVPESDGEAGNFDDTVFINENPEASDDDTFLL